MDSQYQEASRLAASNYIIFYFSQKTRAKMKKKENQYTGNHRLMDKMKAPHDATFSVSKKNSKFPK